MSPCTIRLAVLATLLIPAFSSGTPALAAGAEPTTYVLAEDSTFQRGCFDPCDCLILDEVPLRGTFNLRHVSSDPDWFETYEVSDVHWVTTLEDEEISISGSGIYRIGGNFALRHQLTLDLIVGDEPLEHYDSGLVVGGSEFPAIAARISIHGEFCFDTVMDVHAKPSTTVVVGDAGLAWDLMPTAAGYDVVRGDLATLLATGGDFASATTDCLAAGTSVPEVPFGEVPAPGAAFWFAVRPEGEAIMSTYDSGYPEQARSRDPGIDAAPTSCH